MTQLDLEPKGCLYLLQTLQLELQFLRCFQVLFMAVICNNHFHIFLPFTVYFCNHIARIHELKKLGRNAELAWMKQDSFYFVILQHKLGSR